jgi:hypothetical protein
MPVISYFYGIYIHMYYLDNKMHFVPHIHAIFGEEEEVYSILTGKINSSMDFHKRV